MSDDQVRTRRFFLQTFGCQMNVNDSEKIAGLLRQEGFEPESDPSSADIVFINTCAVREKAERRLFHALDEARALKRRRPGLILVVGGCVAQLQGSKVLERAPFVDVLVGTHSFPRLPELIRRVSSGQGPCIDLDRRADAFVVPHDVIAHTNPVRAYVTVMEGCNQVCSFCVVPRARGPEVNRSDEDIVTEVRSLVARGFPEVMLLGQTVNAYRHQTVDFAALLDRVGQVPGLQRLRFATSHPRFVTTDLADCLRDLRTVCPYVHLPVQSGSDRVLERMRRGHSRLEYLEKVGLLRDRVPDVSLTSDVIVGYPGETETDFQATMDLIDAVGFDGLYISLYSPRPGTPAHGLGDSVALGEKKRRFHELNSKQQQTQTLRNSRRIGRRYEVLIESADGSGHAMGRTRDFRIVHFEGPGQVRDIVEVEITGVGANALLGRQVATTDSLTGSSSPPIF